MTSMVTTAIDFQPKVSQEIACSFHIYTSLSGDTNDVCEHIVQKFNY